MKCLMSVECLLFCLNASFNYYFLFVSTNRDITCTGFARLHIVTASNVQHEVSLEVRAVNETIERITVEKIFAQSQQTCRSCLFAFNFSCLSKLCCSLRSPFLWVIFMLQMNINCEIFDKASRVSIESNF